MIELGPVDWLLCDHCALPAGMFNKAGDVVLLAEAGEVTKVGLPRFSCSIDHTHQGGGRGSVTYDHPLACSDDCERAILLQHGRFAIDVGCEDGNAEDVAHDRAFLARHGNDRNGRTLLLEMKARGLRSLEGR